jgi:hypothetical protein
MRTRDVNKMASSLQNFWAILPIDFIVFLHISLGELQPRAKFS